MQGFHSENYKPSLEEIKECGLSVSADMQSVWRMQSDCRGDPRANRRPVHMHLVGCSSYLLPGNKPPQALWLKTTFNRLQICSLGGAQPGWFTDALCSIGWNSWTWGWRISRWFFAHGSLVGAGCWPEARQKRVPLPGQLGLPCRAGAGFQEWVSCENKREVRGVFMT